MTGHKVCFFADASHWSEVKWVGTNSTEQRQTSLTKLRDKSSGEHENQKPIHESMERDQRYKPKKNSIF